MSQSGQPQSLRDLWYSYSPTYLQGYAGQRYGYTLAVMWDALGDAMAYAVRARFPDCCPSDALPYLAIDRQIDRGPNEAEASYRARLKLWLDLWRHAGSARSVITALEVWFGGTYEIETVAQSQAVGTAWDVYNPATQQIAHQLVSPANWTWDDTNVAPRAWVIVQGGGYSPTTEAYGSGSTWGNGEVFGIKIEPTRSGLKMTTRGTIHKVAILPARVAQLASHMIEKIPPDLSRFLICPMPGLLVALHVKEGDSVEAGQPLAVVEAMKMENILRAEKSAVVKKVNAVAGESLAVDAIILELE